MLLLAAVFEQKKRKKSGNEIEIEDESEGTDESERWY